MVRTIRFLTLLTLLLSSCGEPTGPGAFNWRVEAQIPVDYTRFSVETVGPGGVYGVGRYQGRGVLALYGGGTFTIQTTPAGENVWDVAFKGDAGFLATSRRNGNNAGDAILYRRTNAAWEEVASRASSWTFWDLIAVNTDYCWATTSSSGGKGDIVARYRNGELTAFPDINWVEYTAYAAAEDTFYACAASDKTLFITNDGGATWTRETVTAPPPYAISQITDMCASPAAVYFTVKIEPPYEEEEPFRAIIKRAGPPGRGVYEFSYLGWIGPNAGDIRRCAFRNEHDGVATGNNAAMDFDGVNWIKEQLPYDPYFGYDSLIADPAGGYWGITIHFGYVLCRHP